jgi:hypothetical protein
VFVIIIMFIDISNVISISKFWTIIIEWLTRLNKGEKDTNLVAAM